LPIEYKAQHEDKQEKKIKNAKLLLEEMVLFRTRNGSIPLFIYGTPKWFSQVEKLKSLYYHGLVKLTI